MYICIYISKSIFMWSYTWLPRTYTNARMHAHTHTHARAHIRIYMHTHITQARALKRTHILSLLNIYI